MTQIQLLHNHNAMQKYHMQIIFFLFFPFLHRPMIDSLVITAKTNTSPLICELGGYEDSVRVYIVRTRIFHMKLLIILRYSNIPSADVHFRYMGNFPHKIMI